ncbi:RHS repeat domain-containing protein [Kitasatospora viridis]|uniref:RHS repeat-associated protein n=1 Tax=Kitasatospora viridis TaxID=281105 RepID=A0A561SF03_9ACTN|nr:RHS repeat-associated core domain-containing protein [Kitasatospora viridis]TWF73456.1 RHS repeat-associated protein [Kitasatospora viridis]
MAVVAAMALVVPLAEADTVVGGYRYQGKVWSADPLQAQPKVLGHPATGRKAAEPAAEPAGARPVDKSKVATPKWPDASTATVAVAGGDGSSGAPSGAAGTTGVTPPVSVAAPSAAPGGAPGAAPAAVPGAAKAAARADAAAPGVPTSVRVRTADRDTARAADVDGLLVGLSRADGSSASGKVSVSVDYSSIAQAYGGAWASRLHLVAMPACALTTPQLAQCRTQTPLVTSNDEPGRKLTATVDLPGGGSTLPAAAFAGGGRAVSAALTEPAGASATDVATSSGTAVAAVSGLSSSQGNYAATSLSASGSWSQSSSGAFAYTVPVAVPPSLGGSAPAVALSYDSQSVDGETSARNSQSSWIGDGWDYSPGFIERSYKPCSADGITGSGDECWAGYNATLSLGSHSGQLVRDGNGVYHLQGDDGTRIEDLSGASNGMWNGEYWKVTTTDGTQYYLGLNHSPGTTSDPATNSAWGVPVYMPKPGDPCYDSSKGNASQCSAEPGWRFNLDFVVDPNGNVQRYDWANEANWYNMGAGQSNGSGGAMTAYTRGGYLQQISYGYKLADEQAGHDPAAKVVFTPAQRCTTDPTTCQASNLNANTAANWPDTPYDLNCTQGMATSGTGSTVCQIAAPSFWSTNRLQSIKTSVKSGSAWQDVDSWTLTHQFSDAGATVDPVTGATVDPKDAGSLQSVMWLSQIQHTGLDTSAGGTGNIALDPITFTGVEMDNRVDGSNPPAPPLYHPRISSIQTESGESIAVTYRAPECSRVNNTMPASPDSDTMACYQAYWATPGATQPMADWFQKTLVAQISDNDATKAGSPAKVTSYAYSGGAAWHRDDSDLTDDQYRTWNQFRGYRTVTVTTGAAPDPISQSTTSYFQGMDGDYRSDGSQRSVSLTDSTGTSVTDSAWLAGLPQEVDLYNQAGGTVIAKSLPGAPAVTTTVSSPRTAWTSKSPAPAKLSVLPPLTARLVQSSSSRGLSLLANGSWRSTRTDTTYDSLGRPQQVDNKGDLSAPAQEACTTTSYANAPPSNPMMLSYPSETIVVSGACGTAPGSSTTISDNRVFYDGDGTIANPGTLGQLGANGSTLGLATAAQTVQSYDGSGNPVFQTTSATTYDQYGRVTKVLDPAGSAASTAYTPATGTLPSTEATTNPAGWTATDTIAPARGLVTHAVDVNGRVTDSTYDALGRLTQTWLPGRTEGTQTPDRTFAYAVHGAGSNPDPSSVTTQTLREDNSYATAVDIYDGFLQRRQTQTTTADNSTGRLVSSTHYDSHGLTHSTVPAFVDTTTAPGSTLFVEQENTLPTETVTAYDGTGRQVGQTLYSKAQQLWTWTTAYPGADETDSTPPQGGTPTSTFTDARGRTTSTVAHGGTGTGDVTTSYAYTPAGQVATVKDTTGNTWSYQYDLMGRKVSQSDPDSGTSSTTFDQLGRIATTTDARGQSLAYSYDLLGRPTGEYDGTATTDPTKQLAGWTYDSLAKGYPTSSTRYVGGSGSGGSAYTQAVTGYDTAYQPTGSTVTIPAAEGKLAGSYTMTSKYTANTGLLSDSIFGTEGGLPSEDVGYGYNLQGGLVSTGTMFTPYLDVASYSPLGQIEQSTFGVSGKQLRTAQTYDDATGRLATNRVSLQTASTNPISSTTYGYDQEGNLTTTSELQSSGGTDQVFDTQCFQYDGLRRLTQAWTDTAGQSSPTAGQLAHCTSSGPTPATIGGPAAYWQSYGYDLLGDRTQLVQHDVTGNTANDVTQSVSHPGNGTAAAAQPNTATGITTTGPTGTSTQTPHYDPAGNTTSRATVGVGAGSQTFTYDQEGRTATVSTTVGTNSAQTTGYLYDAQGQLLIQRGPGSTVLYLFGGAEQLTLTGATVTGSRYYANPDGTVIVRATGGTVTYQPTNTQGTAQLEVDSKTLTVTRRSYDPYGNARGTAPSTWADNHGYLGRPADPTTGLDLLGARQYDPSTGRFLSVDPVFEAGDPNQMGGYAYAGDNPSTDSDPTGLFSFGGAWHKLTHNSVTRALTNPDSWSNAAQILGGAAGMVEGGSEFLGGVGVCVLGGIETAGAACAGGLGVAAIGFTTMAAGFAVTAHGTIGLSNDISQARNTDDSGGGGGGGNDAASSDDGAANPNRAAKNQRELGARDGDDGGGSGPGNDGGNPGNAGKADPDGNGGKGGGGRPQGSGGRPHGGGKTGSGGRITVHKYAPETPSEPPHFSVEVSQGRWSLHTEQFHTEEYDDTWIDYHDPEGLTKLDSITIDLPDPQEAMQFQRDQMKEDGFGEYDVITNSCFSHCMDVGRAGGLEASGVRDFAKLFGIDWRELLPPRAPKA